MKLPQKQLKNLGVQLVYLFGSRATEKADPLSDHDFACLLSPSQKDPFKTKLELMGIFSSAVKSDNIDVVMLDDPSVPIDLRYRIISEGKILFNADDQARSDFEYRTMHEYLDRQYCLDRHADISLRVSAARGLQ